MRHATSLCLASYSLVFSVAQEEGHLPRRRHLLVVPSQDNVSWCKAPQLLRGCRYYGSSLGSSNVSTDIKSEHCRCFAVLPHAISPLVDTQALKDLANLSTPTLNFCRSRQVNWTSRVDTVDTVLMSLSSAHISELLLLHFRVKITFIFTRVLTVIDSIIHVYDSRFKVAEEYTELFLSTLLSAQVKDRCGTNLFASMWGSSPLFYVLYCVLTNCYQ